ncbi:AAC(3)-I family aminoglycoside N-acetyltransferase [Isoalcanivorax indicus]|uniref:AAC(3)-I family aminoglycoside N-acetyltransferase n=1 Tax=Isoalcanivorax indicus TaxID=2202653 RepID=UPI000DBA4946|nr:AAC(3)-I family aminoglycoside N-acetyltransferase [Isoalcanivorax indicus]
MTRRYSIKPLGADDLILMGDMLGLFGKAFGQPDVYDEKRPDAAYLRRLLGSDTFVALVAEQDGVVVGGLAAYELVKFEQARSEMYIYDLAVDESCRRLGIATALIEALKGIAADRGAWVIYVQADTGPEDEAAIALYSRLGVREEVLHFDIPVS